ERVVLVLHRDDAVIALRLGGARRLRHQAQIFLRHRCEHAHRFSVNVGNSSRSGHSCVGEGKENGSPNVTLRLGLAELPFSCLAAVYRGFPAAISYMMCRLVT